MYKNIKNSIFKNAKGLIFAASCLLSMSCEATNGDKFSPITMGDLNRLDANLVINPAAVPPRPMTNHQIATAFANRFNNTMPGFTTNMAKYAVKCLASKHIVGEIDETIGIEWHRQTDPGDFLAIDATTQTEWHNGRFHVAYDLLNSALNGQVTYSWRTGNVRHVQIAFNSNYRMFSIDTNTEHESDPYLEAKNPRNVRGIEIRYDTQDNEVITCFPI